MRARRLLSLMLCLCLALTLPPMTALAAGEEIPAQADHPAFGDLAATDELYPYVRYLAGQGIMEGFPDGTFRPGATLTRAEAAKIAVLTRGISPAPNSVQSFSDVSVAHWAYSYIETAAAAGLVNGYPGGAFGPGEPITRAEAAALLIRLAGGEPADDALAIADVVYGNWAYQPAVTAVQAGLLGLSSDGAFVPGAAFTRGELTRCLSVLFALGPDLRPAALVGKLTVTRGQVTVADKDGHNSPVDAETAVGAGMTVTTGAGSRAEIAFDDGSGLRLEPGTQISVARADGYRYMRPDGTPGVAVDKLEIKLNGGSIFSALANRNEGQEENYIAPAAEGSLQWWEYTYAARERIRILSPSSVMGYYGTFGSAFSNLGLGGGGGQAAVLSGHVVVSAGGQSVVLGGGQGTAMPPATSGGGQGPPAPPAPLTPEQQQQFQSAQDWILYRAQEIQNNAPLTPPTPLPPQTGGGSGTPPSPPSPPTPGLQFNNVYNTIQGALGQAGGGGPSSGGDSGGDSGSDTQTYTPPAIAGPDTINLTSGYATYHQAYTLSGDPVPSLAITGNSAEATLSGNMVTIPAGLPAGQYHFTLTASNSAGTVTKTVTVNVAGTLPAITGGLDTISLMEGYENYALAYNFAGDPTPTAYGISASHPNTANATFAGTTLTIPGGPDGLTAEDSPYTVTLYATNALGTTTRTIAVTISPVTITLSPASLPDALFGVAYPATTLTAAGGYAPYTFTVDEGLPDGLGLDPSGAISGTAGDTGDYTFTVTATDSHGNAGTREYTIHTYPMISITCEWYGWGEDPVAELIAEGGAEGEYTFALSPEDDAAMAELLLTLHEDGSITSPATEGPGVDSVDVHAIVTDGHGNSVTLPTTITFYLD